ncbi:hypothetical protein LguiA_030686 [Lonicera macranthoides]
MDEGKLIVKNERKGRWALCQIALDLLEEGGRDMGHSRHLWRWTKGSHPTPAVDLPAKIPLGHLPRTKIFNLGAHVCKENALACAA